MGMRGEIAGNHQIARKFAEAMYYKIEAKKFLAEAEQVARVDPGLSVPGHDITNIAQGLFCLALDYANEAEEAAGDFYRAQSRAITEANWLGVRHPEPQNLNDHRVGVLVVEIGVRDKD